MTNNSGLVNQSQFGKDNLFTSELNFMQQLEELQDTDRSPKNVFN